MQEACLDLDDGEVTLGAVREWVCGILDELEPNLLDDVLLVANELVSNTLDHAEGPRTLTLRLNDGRLRIEATDGSPHIQPVLGRSRLNESRGRGLVIVNACSTSWGVESAEESKTTWAEVSVLP